MKRIIVAGALAAMLAACGHNITLVPRGPGLPAYGKAPSAWGDTGKLSLTLNGKTYSGSWVFVRDGGTVGSAFGTAWTTGAAVTGSSTFFGVSTKGTGQALLIAPDGAKLRCVFQYNEWGGAGMGECLDDAGQIYDMQIN